jgi:hypothetical protein
MDQFFKDPRTRLRLHEGPLGPYIDSYAAEMRAEGYAQQTAEVQIRLVADFSRWLAKCRITAPEITAEHFRPYLGARARRRRPALGDRAALKRLSSLLRRQGVIPEPALPAATPVDQLQSAFRLYLQQERALASTTRAYYLTFAGEFLTERFGTGIVDLTRDWLRTTNVVSNGHIHIRSSWPKSLILE